MAVIVFDQLLIPIPNHLLGRLKVFSDGNLGIHGVRVVTQGTKPLFHVLDWSDIEVLHGLNVDLTGILDTLRVKATLHNHSLLMRRVKYQLTKGTCNVN